MPISESYFTGITDAQHIRDHMFVDQEILNKTKWFDARRDVVIAVIVSGIVGFGGWFVNTSMEQMTIQQTAARTEQTTMMKQLIEEVKLMREAKQ